MKYLPIVWAALRRNPVESLFTLLAMTAAFTLFGSMIALNAAYDRILATVRMDQLFVVCAFRCEGLPIGYRDQLARIPGITAVGYMNGLNGYRQERTQRLSVSMMDAGMRNAWSDLTLTSADWDALEKTPTGVFFSRSAAARWQVTPGDTFPIVVEPSIRADGDATWIFTVLGIFEDTVESRAGQGPKEMVVGNFHYFNESRRLSDRNKGGFIRVSVDHEDHARKICEQVEARFANASTPIYCVPARDDAAQLMSANLNMRYVSLGVAAAGLFMILFICGNGIAESVRERLPELGVLKTLGFDDRSIATLVFLEAATLASIGAVVGIAIAWAGGDFLSRIGGEFLQGTPPPAVSVSVLGWSMAAALLVAAVSTAFPLRRITRMDIASVLAGK
jgi:putative ABC transport system permease protein